MNKEEKKVYMKEWRQKNKDEIKKYKQEHKDEIKEYNKAYRQEHKEHHKAYYQEYQQEHKDEIKEFNKQYQKARRQTDPNYKLRTKMSSSIAIMLKKTGGSKNGKSIMDYLPYTIQDLKVHIESQFQPWMSWDNHGKYNVKTWNDNDSTTWTWHIDHIIPQSSFKYTSMDDDSFKKCWSLENLRPLSAKQNIIDGARK